jgi:hypothetical protein
MNRERQEAPERYDVIHFLPPPRRIVQLQFPGGVWFPALKSPAGHRGSGGLGIVGGQILLKLLTHAHIRRRAYPTARIFGAAEAEAR